MKFHYISHSRGFPIIILL